MRETLGVLRVFNTLTKPMAKHVRNILHIYANPKYTITYPCAKHIIFCDSQRSTFETSCKSASSNLETIFDTKKNNGNPFKGVYRLRYFFVERPRDDIANYHNIHTKAALFLVSRRNLDVA